MNSKNIQTELSDSLKPLVAVKRGDLIEKVHFGAYCIVENDYDPIYFFGNSEFITYTRSTAKPFQALSVILSEADEKFNLNEKDIAIISSSHFGQPEHVLQVKSILEKIGLKYEDLLCPAVYSRDNNTKYEQIRSGLEPSKYFCDCSAKHAGMLAACKALGYDIKNYDSPSHPLQILIKNILSSIYDFDIDKMIIGVDGCGVPVFSATLKSMAHAYLSLINGKLNDNQTKRFENIDFDKKEVELALKKVRNSMVGNPSMIAGDSGICTVLMTLYGGSLVGKIGADGVYCVGLKDFATSNSIGIAVKIADGSMDALEFAVVSILKRLNCLVSTRSNFIDRFLCKKCFNEHGIPVGEYQFLDGDLPSLASLLI